MSYAASDEIVERILKSRKIDPHIHCRDGRQAYKATIRQVKEFAKDLGIVAIGDMPNKEPPITSERNVMSWLRFAESEGCLEGYYLYIGATNNPEQIEEAASVASENPKVLGIKYFTTGGGVLTISNEKDQLRFYETLAKHNYTDIVAIHCEKESLFRMDKWNPERPWTWNEARPPQAETAAVEDQIKFAKEAGFEGVLYILHVTVGETIDLIDAYRGDINIYCGVTPHHLLIPTSYMMGRNGLIYKTNPPVRPEKEVEILRERLEEGKIDCIESDHAPHTPNEKFEKYLSGYTSYEIYPRLIESLVSWGLGEERILDLTYNNAKRIFKKIIE